jgi:hypothetical protein
MMKTIFDDFEKSYREANDEVDQAVDRFLKNSRGHSRDELIQAARSIFIDRYQDSRLILNAEFIYQQLCLQYGKRE